MSTGEERRPGFLARPAVRGALLALALALPLAVLLAAAALDVERGRTRTGLPGEIAHALAGAPFTALTLLGERDRLLAANQNRAPGRTGWQFRDPPPGGAAPAGYLLVSRYDGDRRRHTVELLDLGRRAVVHAWWPDADTLLADAPRSSAITDFTRWNTATFRAIHPLLLDDGGLIVKDHETPLFLLDACARPLWRQDRDLFHHSTELGPDGNLYVPLRLEPAAVAGVAPGFSDDAIGVVSPAGELVSAVSVATLLEASGRSYLLFNAGDAHPDPIHLNDIEPVRADGPFWRRGDLFLSLRTRSAVALYRPATGAIVWFRQGPWLGQHDVDILDDRRIAVFSNNSEDRDGTGGRVAGVSEIMVYDFATDTVTSPWRAALEAAGVKTLYEGLQDPVPDGHVLIEEEGAGRLLILGPDGRIAAEFVNRAGDGRVYRLGWSRYVPKDAGDRALAALGAALATGACPRQG